MGNCGGCDRTNAPEQYVVTKQDRIEQFEEMLPFRHLYIDEFESLVMAVAQIQKINNEYQPTLRSQPCRFSRIVKYFKSIDEFKALQHAQSRLSIILRSSFLSSQTYHRQEKDELLSFAATDDDNEEYKSGGSSRPSSASGASNTLYGSGGSEPFTLDTESFLLLGLLFCRDRQQQKASIFYSILRGATSHDQLQGQQSIFKHKSNASQEQKFDELSCMNEAIETTVFKICILSHSFVEHHALPARAGKTEIKMLHTAFALRTSVFFEVFQTFIQHVWSQ